jgi:UPF0148 protein
LSDDIKKMAELLKRRATMLSEACPNCNSPLFKIGDEIRCPKCDRRVIIVRDEEEATKLSEPNLLKMAEDVLLQKLGTLTEEIRRETDTEILHQKGRLLLIWMEALERIRKASKG